MWTRIAVVLALTTGCEEQRGNTEAAKAPSVATPKDAAVADEPVDAAALRERGRVLYNASDWLGAVPVLEQVRTLPEIANDPEALLDVEWQLGACYAQLRELDKAIPTLRSALKRATALLGADDIFVAQIKESLGAALDYNEEYAEAETLFRDALARYEKSEAPEVIGTALSNLAVNLEYQKRDADALATFKRVVALLDKEGPSEALAEAHSGIGRVHGNHGDTAAQIKAFRKALEVRRAATGDNHPSVGRDYHNLATVLLDVPGKEREGRVMCKNALANRRRTLPADHPYRINTEQMCAELGAPTP